MPPAGGFSNYEKDMAEVVRLFELKKRGFPWKTAEALATFLETKKREGDQLISVSLLLTFPSLFPLIYVKIGWRVY
jgi:hypothetical protein